jgi:hypothetical protein
LKSLGLSCLQRTIVWQESRLLWLSEGDTHTMFFHAHANTHCHKQFIRLLEHGVQVMLHEDRKADIIYNFFDDLLGTPSSQANSINLGILDIPVLQLSELDKWFIEEQVLHVIRSMPPNKATGPDGFTIRFLQQTWDIIRPELMKAFDAFWHMDIGSFHSINEALMVLLPKKSGATTICEFQPISFIHILGKLFSKVKD